jgi:RNA polymerase sigma-70 factor (ECF subfamily)
MTSNDFKYKILPLSQRIFPLAARLLGNDDEAQDAVQEIMIKLWNARKQLDKHPNISGFVFLTARNYCFDLLRGKKKDIMDTMNQDLIVDLYVDQRQEGFEDVFMIIRKIISELPEKQREVILMRDIDGFEFDEIVAMTEIKIEHIRVLLSRARKQVRIQLKNVYNYEERIYG